MNAVLVCFKRSPFTIANKGLLSKIRPEDILSQVINDLIKTTNINKDDIEDIIDKTNAWLESSHKLAERMYQEQTADSGATGGNSQPDENSKSEAHEDVVDAEFEEVKDGKE